MLRRFTQISVFVVVQAWLVAQTTPATRSANPTPEPVLQQIKECVVFITGNYTANGSPRQLMGTGFLVSSPEPRIGADRSFMYLVTNKHMIREPDASGKLGAGPYFSTVDLRINLKQAHPDGTQYDTSAITVVSDTGDLVWFVDKLDDTVDLAVVPITITEANEFKTIPVSLFATEQVLTDRHVNENDEVLFTGLFAWHPGAKKNYPIVRHGKLARLFQERIPLDRSNPAKTVAVHLADVMSFGGNSGSPVFLRIGGVRDDASLAGYSYFLLGVMQGFFPEGLDVTVDVAEKHGVAAQNSGIAAVIPADKITALIDGPRGKAYRERNVGLKLLQDGDLTKAEKCFQDAIAYLEFSAPQTADMAAALEAYASLLRKTNRMVEAANAEKRAAKIRSDKSIDRLNPRM